MFGRASRTGLIACVGALLWLISAGSAHAAPSWLPAFDLGFPAQKVAMSADGTTVYAGRPFVGGIFRAAVRVRPPGGPLGPVQYLSADGDTVSGLSVASGGDGRFVAAWIDSGVVKTAVMPEGATAFADVLPMPSASGQTPQSTPAIAVDGAGNGLMLWDASGTSSAFVRFGERPATGSIPATQQLDGVSYGMNGGASGQDLDIAAAADGSAIAAWVMNQTTSTDTITDARAALRKPGQPFGSAIPLGSGIYSGGPPNSSVGATSADMTASGHGAVVWHESSDNGTTQASTIQFREGDATAGLGSKTDATPGFGSQPGGPVLALTPDGRVAIATIANVSGTNRPQVALRPPDGVFGIVRTLATDGPAAISVNLAAGASGALLAGWSTYSSSWAVAGAAAPSGGDFGAAIPLASNLTGASPQPDVAVAPHGDGVAAWANDTGASAAGFDASPPVFPAPAFPTGATVGAPAAFSVGTPTDIWGPIASIAWDFGDGATADGASISHTYGAPGTPTATLTVTDAAGNAASAGAAVSVGTAATGTGTDAVAPTVTAASLTRTVFVVGPAPTALTASRHGRGTVIRYTLSEAASVQIAIARAAPGRRHAGRCVKPTRKLRAARRCTRFVLRGTLRRTSAAGAHRLPFSGRLGTRPLTPGRYRARITATDAAGNTGRPVTLRFRIVRR